MTSDRRWDPAIAYSDRAASLLFETLSELNHQTLLICGAGFDPRTALFAEMLRMVGATNVRGVFLQEHRDRAENSLAALAQSNLNRLKSAVPDHAVVELPVFETDGAVAIGRNAALTMHGLDLSGIRHVIVDTSALSIGASFPVIGYLVKSHGKGSPELHVVAFHDPLLDAAIRPLPADNAEFVHGFQGGFGLDENSAAATLWLPQLSPGQSFPLERLYAAIEPDDTCPILPFPSSNPRAADELVSEYVDEFATWAVDSRSLVYASERDPIDLYRTVLDLDAMRSEVFSEAGGSQIVLSPLGSKVTALGALLAALEHDLPVAYVESVGFTYNPSTPPGQAVLTHVWLEGSVYPDPRPPLSNHGI